MSLSKSILGSSTSVTKLTDVLKPVVGPLPSQAKGGSSRIQSGLQAMFDKAKLEGYEAGRNEGHADGIAVGRIQGWKEVRDSEEAMLAEFQGALQSVVQQTLESIENWYVTAEQSLTTLAIEIAKRAVCQELELSRQSVLEITKNALQEVRHGTSVRIRVNPIDSAILESKREQVLAAASCVRDIEIVSDGSINGGCIIDTDGGVIDSRIENFLERLHEEAA